MARLALTQAGAALGRRLMPQSIQFLGKTISGASLGRRLGGLAADSIEAALTPPREGPRLEELHVMESREGAGIFNVYGRFRVAGQLIWAGDFTENRSSQGGKGGPRVNTYSYTVSFAVGVCEGPGARIERIWANGEPLAKGRYTIRTYPGSGDQMPDPAIEAELGAGLTPAYRDLCYIVFEDFPLEDFGNRIPNLSLEVVRAPAGTSETGVTDEVRAVNMIPATGEFVYATTPVSARTFPGRDTPLNVHTEDGRADLLVSLDQLQSELPEVEAVSLTVGWFGDDLRAGQCRIRPGVETRDRMTVPQAWRAGDVGRSAAYLISRAEDGSANYGGTPADDTVVQSMREMAQRGLDVTVTPFLLMDVPPGNAMGQPVFPWRGRIAPLFDGSAQARSEIEAFLGTASVSDFHLDGDRVIYSGPGSDWGYRRFILHLAWLAKASGVCTGFLIGSEMRDLTRSRDEAGLFPFVEGLIGLADDVKALLGPTCQVSYAADWSEYGAYVPGDGSDDVLFPLDDLWARQSVDFVGIDWYPPAGDWRDGTNHTDYLAGVRSPGERSYIEANQSGGEGYDWYYASQADRDAQLRTPIDDTQHGAHWIFRPKDVVAWWGNAHFPRPGGVQSSTPTPWVPSQKPVRFSEIGFPAVDKGTNSPNLFYDPKSSESAVPPYSNGARDDVLQAEALSGALAYWRDQPCVDQAVVWAWDARPFPVFPSDRDVWSDGDNWSFGHWLNGRTGLSPLAQVIEDLCDRAGVSITTSGVLGLVEGYALSGHASLADVLDPLFLAYDLALLEFEDQLVAETVGSSNPIVIDANAVAAPLKKERDLGHVDIGRMRLRHAGLSNDYQVEVSEVRSSAGDMRIVGAVSAPLALSTPEAERIAQRLLDRANEVAAAELEIPSLSGPISVGAHIEIEGQAWRVSNASRAEVDTLRLVPPRGRLEPLLGVSAPKASPPSLPGQDPDVLIVDGPWPPERLAPQILVAGYVRPWPGPLNILRGASPEALDFAANAQLPAITGRLLTDLVPGKPWRWMHAAEFDIEVSQARLSSHSEIDVLAGRNRLLVQAASGWECLAFQEASLIGERMYRLRGLLRGLWGSETLAETSIAAGARCVLVDEAVVPVPMTLESVGLPEIWKFAGAASEQALTFENRGARPLTPVHAFWNAGSGSAKWHARDRAISDNWDVPDPVLDLRFEVEVEGPGATTEIREVEGTELALEPGRVASRVRTRSKDGWLSAWVPFKNG
ncbi:MAG: glycoside hydrolase TIM-barrel-like domain-containing protein [Pseudomonadota bacterium]